MGDGNGHVEGVKSWDVLFLSFATHLVRWGGLSSPSSPKILWHSILFQCPKLNVLTFMSQNDFVTVVSKVLMSSPLSSPTTLLFLLLLNYKGIYTYLWLRNAIMNTLTLTWSSPWSSFLLVHSEGLQFDIISCKLLYSKFLMLVIAPYFSLRIIIPPFSVHAVWVWLAMLQVQR